MLWLNLLTPRVFSHFFNYLIRLSAVALARIDLHEGNYLTSKSPSIMAKKSKRRPSRTEKNQTGCISGLIRIFDFRNDRSTRKLLSDRQRGNKQAVGKNYVYCLYQIAHLFCSSRCEFYYHVFYLFRFLQIFTGAGSSRTKPILAGDDVKFEETEVNMVLFLLIVKSMLNSKLGKRTSSCLSCGMWSTVRNFLQD